MDVLDRIGLFDETFFLYFEETDLCLRAARAGHQVHYVRESTVAHVGSASTGMKDWGRVPDYWFDSRHYYFAKNHGRLFALAATAAHLTGAALHRLRCALTGRAHGDRPGFLTTLLTHDVRAALRPRPRAQVPALAPTGV
jgi:GT2 family glycosyltransferase